MNGAVTAAPADSLEHFLAYLEDLCGPGVLPALCVRFLNLTGDVNTAGLTWFGGTEKLERDRAFALWILAWCVPGGEDGCELDIAH